MANRCLLPLYKKLYDKDFDCSIFDQRKEMQKAIFLLQDMGVPVGDYGFRWYLHGPYSQSLQEDMFFVIDRQAEESTLSNEYDSSIERLHALIHSPEKGSYSICNWVECLASLHYLRENVVPFNATDEAVVAELERRKKHLNEHEVNMIAYKKVEELFV